ncbi:MAG: hypothetical protein ACNA8P_03995 [Phycisphaerales bacterium]
MQKPRNRYKTRRPAKRTRTRRTRKEAPSSPQGVSLVGRASCPSPTPPPLLPSPNPSSSSTDDHLIEPLLRLWEHDDLTLADIADHLGLTLRALLALIDRPEVDDLLTRMDTLLERRTRRVALSKSRRALLTLEQVQTEAEADASITPDTPEAIKAHRDARNARTQRRLAATVTLNQLKVLKPPVRKAAPVSDRCREAQQARAA